jgi:hypothetical protein
MTFVYPGFLFGLLLVGIPILVHLIQLRKYKRIEFSNAFFLKALKQEQQQSQRLKNLLILLSRIAFIIFLVLAFAQPYFPSAANESISSSVVSIYIDNSYSMQVQSSNGMVLDRAKAKAIEIVKAYPPQQKYQVLANKFNGNQMRLLSADEALEAIDALSIVGFTQNVSSVLEQQQRFLQQQMGQAKEAYLVSDFQESFVADQKLKQVDSSIRWNILQMASNAQDNISIDSVYSLKYQHQAQSEEQLVVRLQNHGKESIQTNLSVKVNGELKFVARIAIPAQGNTTDTISFRNPEADFAATVLQIEDDGLMFDDTYYLCYPLKLQANVYVLQGKQAHSEILSAYKTEPFFNVANGPQSAPNFEAMRDAQLLILDAVDTWNEGILAAITEAMQEGKNIAYFPSATALEKDAAFFSIVGLEHFVGKQEVKERVSKINQNSTLFEGVFSGQMPQQAELPFIHTSYLNSPRNEVRAESILRLPNGLSVFNRYTLGKKYSNLFVCSFGLEKAASDLTNQAIFVPILLRMGMLQKNAQELAFEIAPNLRVSMKNYSINVATPVTLILGDTRIIPELKLSTEGYQMRLFDQMQQAGIYSLQQDKRLISKLAFNHSRAESDMRFSVDPLEVLSYLPNTKSFTASEASISNIIKEGQKEGRFWKICVILALLFMAIEILLSRFATRWFSGTRGPNT